MSIDSEIDSIRLQLLLGRLFFDGATPALLTERYGVSAEDVTTAWQFCRRKLSEQLAKSAAAEYRLLDEDELRSRATECLRLLLDWRDALLTEARVQSFARHGNTLVDDDPELNSDRDIVKPE